MVQKATQQLLFDVDWRGGGSSQQLGSDLDCLVVDMPPGTGDVQLTIAQLAKVDGQSTSPLMLRRNHWLIVYRRYRSFYSSGSGFIRCQEGNFDVRKGVYPCKLLF